jgi:hypothetical protein
VIEDSLNWNDRQALVRRVELLSKLTNKTYFLQYWNRYRDNLMSLESGQRPWHTKALSVTQNRAIVEWLIAEARRPA